MTKILMAERKRRKNHSSLKNLNGGEGWKADELSPVACFELKIYPEPKALQKQELEPLFKHFPPQSLASLLHRNPQVSLNFVCMI